MTRPVDRPEWATDTNFSTSPAAGENGTPTKVLPSVGFYQEGWVPGKTFVGQYLNRWMHNVYQWCEYVRTLATDPDFLGDDYAWTGEHSFTQDVTLSTGSIEVNYASRPTRLKGVNLMRGVFTSSSGVQILGGNYTQAGRVAFPSGGASVRYVLPIDLPKDQGLVGIDVDVFLGGAKDVTCELHRVSYNAAGSDPADVLVWSETRNTVSGAQQFTTTFTESTNSVGLASWYLLISNSSSGASDYVRNVVPNWLETGIRSGAV
jgi:hypothetical protein